MYNRSNPRTAALSPKESLFSGTKPSLFFSDQSPKILGRGRARKNKAGSIADQIHEQINSQMKAAQLLKSQCRQRMLSRDSSLKMDPGSVTLPFPVTPGIKLGDFKHQMNTFNSLNNTTNKAKENQIDSKLEQNSYHREESHLELPRVISNSQAVKNTKAGERSLFSLHKRHTSLRVMSMSRSKNQSSNQSEKMTLRSIKSKGAANFTIKYKICKAKALELSHFSCVVAEKNQKEHIIANLKQDCHILANTQIVEARAYSVKNKTMIRIDLELLKQSIKAFSTLYPSFMEKKTLELFLLVQEEDQQKEVSQLDEGSIKELVKKEVNQKMQVFKKKLQETWDQQFEQLKTNTECQQEYLETKIYNLEQEQKQLMRQFDNNIGHFKSHVLANTNGRKYPNQENVEEHLIPRRTYSNKNVKTKRKQLIKGNSYTNFQTGMSTFSNVNLQKQLRDTFKDDSQISMSECPEEEFSFQNLDLVFFYSEPLVDEVWDERTKKLKLVATSFMSLQTDVEYHRLIQILKSTKKKFKISRQALNFESLKETISSKPKIIHISCHGDFNETQNEFYLQFEGSGNGITDKFSRSRLIELLGSERDHGIQLAFVSACYSEEIGDILFNCNIPLVISVNSFSQISDEKCLIFSRHLYMQLLQGQSIRRSFDEAQRTCRASQTSCKSCCCAHSHTSDCKWKQYAIKNGYEKAHELHSQECSCKLPLNKHKKNCKVYQEFMIFIREFKSDKIKPAAVANENPWAFDDDFDFETNLVTYDQKEDDNVLCCCRKNEPHDESFKFILKADPRNLDTVIFQQRPVGQVIEVQDKDAPSKIPGVIDESWIIGRNLEIQDIVSKLTNQQTHRIIKVFGPIGCGKQVIAKKAVRYCIERNFFPDGAINIEAGPSYNCQNFLNLFCQKLRLNINHLDDIIDYVHMQRMVLIISECDSLLKNNRTEFINLVVNIHDHTKYLKIILITSLKEDFTIPGCKTSSYVSVKPLQRVNAVRFLRSLDQQGEVMGMIDEQHSIFDSQLTNQKLQDIFMLLKSNKTFEEVVQILQKEQEQQETNQNELDQTNYNIQLILYQHMDKKYENEKNLLHLLSQAPNGMMFNDIKMLISDKPWYYGDWTSFLQEMIFNSHCERTLMASEILGNKSDLESKSSFSDSSDAETIRHGFQVIFQKENDDLGENIYFLKNNIRGFINKQVLFKSRKFYFVQFIRYFSKLGRQYLRNLKIDKNQDFELTLLSAEIDSGFWSIAKFATLHHLIKHRDIETQISDNVTQRLAINEGNFMEAFDYDNVTSILGNNLSKMPYVIQFLDEIYCTFVAIMIIQHREQDASLLLDQAIRICRYFHMERTVAKLSLTQISLDIKNKRLFDTKRMLYQCEQQFKSCLDYLGIGETQILMTIFLHTQFMLQEDIMSSTTLPKIKKTNSQHGSFKFSDIGMREMAFALETQDQSQFISGETQGQKTPMLNTMSTYNNFFLSARNLEKDNEDIMKQIEKGFLSAQNLFKRLNQTMAEARLILLNANFYYQNIETMKPKFIACLDDLMRAETFFNQTLNQNHRVKCLIFISLIYLMTEDHQTGKQKILVALEVALQIQDHQEMMHAQEILDQIQLQIQINSNNLIMYFDTYPLVDEGGQEINNVYQQAVFNANFDKMANIMRLTQINKQVNFKYEIMTRKQLDYLRDYGCRILVINQRIFDDEPKIHIEGSNGQLEKISSAELYDILKPQEGRLNVDVVFLNIMNGKEFGQIFKRLGVQQIFTYELQYDNFNKFLLYKFQDEFSQGVVLKLLCQQSFFKAHTTTLKKMNQKLSSYDDHLVWIQGEFQSQGNKLFSQDSMDERQMLKEGRVEDQSLPLSPSNLTIQQGPIIGRNKEMFMVLSQLSKPFIKFVLITGIKGIGKTRFVKELISYMNLRRVFSDGAYYLNFESVESQSEIFDVFKEAGIEYLLKKPNQSNTFGEMVEMHHEHLENQHCTSKLKKMVLVYDNIDKINLNSNAFMWHLRQVQQTKFNIKFMMTSLQPSKEIVNNETFEIKLNPLSFEYSVQLIKLYSLSKMESKMKAHIRTSQKKCSSTELSQEDIKIKLCQGNPSNLMALALAMRCNKIDTIFIKQVKVSKEDKSNSLKGNERRDSISSYQYPSSIQQELYNFHRKQRVNQIRQQQLEIQHLSDPDLMTVMDENKRKSMNQVRLPSVSFKPKMKRFQTKDIIHMKKQAEKSISMNIPNLFDYNKQEKQSQISSHEVKTESIIDEYENEETQSLYFQSLSNFAFNRKSNFSQLNISKIQETFSPKVTKVKMEDFPRSPSKHRIGKLESKERLYSQQTGIKIYGKYPLIQEIQIFQHNPLNLIEMLQNIQFNAETEYNSTSSILKQFHQRSIELFDLVVDQKQGHYYDLHNNRFKVGKQVSMRNIANAEQESGSLDENDEMRFQFNRVSIPQKKNHSDTIKYKPFIITIKIPVEKIDKKLNDLIIKRKHQSSKRLTNLWNSGNELELMKKFQNRQIHDIIEDQEESLEEVSQDKMKDLKDLSSFGDQSSDESVSVDLDSGTLSSQEECNEEEKDQFGHRISSNSNLVETNFQDCKETIQKFLRPMTSLQEKKDRSSSSSFISSTD